MSNLTREQKLTQIIVSNLETTTHPINGGGWSVLRGTPEELAGAIVASEKEKKK